ncbi:MAG: class I SAM-dependent rRNA methyltransferase [Anaerolineaceae bacterium]|jgi:23S rRNA (cytosine1962-C5)-methyltransferase|nr:class I SAM-dependent rRNA methyltransferase [Anaerolineaceae bacterium]
MNKNILTLKPDRDKSVLQRRPWIFSGAVARVEGSPEMGDTVMVKSADGQELGLAAYSPNSQIRARMWTWDADQQVDTDFLKAKISEAIAMRRKLIPVGETTSVRLVHAESDGIPGLVVDQYGDVLVMQVLTAGVEKWREEIKDILVNLIGTGGVYERSDVEVRHLEGLEPRSGLLYGGVPDPLVVEENGLKFLVDVAGGQKTGFYVDQRRNRQKVREAAEGRDVLNCFCYTGAFSVYAAAGGAKSVLSVDSSDEALVVAEENRKLNGLPDGLLTWQAGDVFKDLRTMRDSRQSFDLIVLDPPKFAPTSAQAKQAVRGYKDINLLAFKLLRPGGLLFTFSCSGGVKEDLFQKVVAGAALDAGVDARIVDRMHQGVDHPVALQFPEGAYLKGLVCEVRE